MIGSNRIDTEIFFSCSPKLFTVTVKREKKQSLEIVAEYRKLSDKGQLKFVVGPMIENGMKWKK